MWLRMYLHLALFCDCFLLYITCSLLNRGGGQYAANEGDMPEIRKKRSPPHIFWFRQRIYIVLLKKFGAHLIWSLSLQCLCFFHVIHVQLLLLKYSSGAISIFGIHFLFVSLFSFIISFFSIKLVVLMNDRDNDLGWFGNLFQWYKVDRSYRLS